MKTLTSQFDRIIYKFGMDRRDRYKNNKGVNNLEFHDILFYDGDISEDEWFNREKDQFKKGFKKSIINK